MCVGVGRGNFLQHVEQEDISLQGLPGGWKISGHRFVNTSQSNPSLENVL